MEIIVYLGVLFLSLAGGFATHKFIEFRSFEKLKLKERKERRITENTAKTKQEYSLQYNFALARMGVDYASKHFCINCGYGKIKCVCNTCICCGRGKENCKHKETTRLKLR